MKTILITTTFAIAASSHAVTIVNWGSAGGDLGIITSGTADNTSINTTYTPGTDITNGISYYGGYDPAIHSPTFNGASSRDNKIEVRDDGAGDRFSHPVNMGAAGGTQQTMFGWESGTHTLASAVGLSLDTFALEHRDRGNTNTGNVQLLVQSTGQWYISDQSSATANSYTSWTGSYSTLTWKEFTPFSSGSFTIGAAATPSLEGVDAVGFFGEVTSTANWAEIRTRHFNVTASAIPEPSGFVLLGLAGLSLLRRRRA